MIAINQNVQGFENFSANRFMQWLFAIIIGTAITLASFVILPSLNYKDPVNPEPLVELEFLPWQKVQPEPIPPLPEKKTAVVPKPKPKPVVQAKPEPKPAPKPEVVEKSVPDPEPAPMEELLPQVSEIIPEPAVETTEAPTETPVTDNTAEALPTPVPIFQLSNLPRFMRKVNPEYPLSLKLQGITGAVKLAVLIDATGKVRDIEVISSTHPEFAQAAIDAIQNSSFQPADINGKPVATRYKIPFKFRLQ